MVTTNTINNTPVRIYARKAGGIYPIHGAYLAGNDEWVCTAWTSAGRKFADGRCSLDLISIDEAK